MVKIIADSTCDISSDEAEKLGIEILPITIRFGDEEFLDGVNITHEEFYDKLDRYEELPKTSQISPAVFEDIFEKHLKNGDEIAAFFISSELSGTYQSATIAAMEAAEKYNANNRLHIVDTQNVSIGSALIIREAVKLRDAGLSAEQIALKCSELSKHIRLYAMVGSLKYLKKGGRLSNAEAFAGSLLHITPIISIENGKVAIAGKVRGKKAAETFILNKMYEYKINKNHDFIFGHINSLNMLTPFKEKAASMVCNINADIITGSIGCAVGTHVGPGTIGVAYIEE